MRPLFAGVFGLFSAPDYDWHLSFADFGEGFSPNDVFNVFGAIDDFFVDKLAVPFYRRTAANSQLIESTALKGNRWGGRVVKGCRL